ncbi:MAG: L,D-transpeptidase [Hyphomonadaceae bacterium]
MSFRAQGDGTFTGPGISARCTLGPAGIIPASEKRESDRASPGGVYLLRRVLYRADREAAPETALPVYPIAPDDGWCDAPADPLYNLPVKLPYPASAEKLWRVDHLFDLVVVLGHNDDPVIPGFGSAIFWHLARNDGGPTQGCVGVNRETMLRALKIAKLGDTLRIG